MMYPMFPFATSSSMMSAFRIGTYRAAMDCASCKTTTASSSFRCGRNYSTSSPQRKGSSKLELVPQTWREGQVASGGLALGSFAATRLSSAVVAILVSSAREIPAWPITSMPRVKARKKEAKPSRSADSASSPLA